jgi:hypothetical protein
VVYGWDLVRDLLAISHLSDQTRSFLSDFFAKIYNDWNKIDVVEVGMLESQLEVCLRSPDVLKTLGEASPTLSQMFYVDLPQFVYLADGADYYDLVHTSPGSTSPTIITPDVQLEFPCTCQLQTALRPHSCSCSSRLMFLLKLLHRPGSRTTEAFSGKNLPSGLGSKINNFLSKPDNGTLVKDVTSQLKIHHGLEVEIVTTNITQCEALHFAVAIERWIVLSRQEIVGKCRTIPKKDALGTITSSLAPICNATVVISDESSVIKIDLFEPFSQSRMFIIPVRE